MESAEKILSAAGEIGWGFGDGGSVFAGVGGAVVDGFDGIAEDGLAAAHQVGKIALHLEVVAPGGEGVADVGGDAVLDEEVAASPGGFGEAGSLQGQLDVHSVVDHVGDELGVSLGLVEA